jgi:hypothetical protein
MGDDISKTISGFMEEQLTLKKGELEAKAKARRHAAGAARARSAITIALSAVLIVASIWWVVRQTQPPGFVKMLDVAENASGSTLTVSGKVKNMTHANIAERTWMVDYFDTEQKRKPIAEVPLVIKDLKVGETRSWSVEVPNWRPGLRRVIRPKEDQG